jgi:squalene-hopene/tetraprenyl-beta-curcumene cyclase
LARLSFASKSPSSLRQREHAGASVEVVAALNRAFEHAARTQLSSGGWESIPDPRVLENALTLYALRASPSEPRIEQALDKCRRWLERAAPQTHHPLVATIESWLQRLALGANEPLILGHSFADPVISARSRLAHALAVHAGVAVSQDRAALRREVAEAHARSSDDALKPWSAIELLSIRAVVELSFGDQEAVNQACNALAALQAADGSFMANPISTAMACLALNIGAPHGAAARRARACLIDAQSSDGTWRFCTSDIWDTTLTLRAFSGMARFDEILRPRAVEFLLERRNRDGGWSFRQGVESDSDTTSAALIALDRAAGSEEQVAAALAYLRRHQEPSGLWRTWHFKKDPPAEDVVAHVVTALRLYGDRHDLELESARRWLCSKFDGGWKAGWYMSRAYGLSEVSDALGGHHPQVREAITRAMPTQNSDGGFGSVPSGNSWASATGLMLAATVPELGSRDPRVTRGCRYLIDAQNVDGTWAGHPEMYGPRPFASHYQAHTQAFAVFGLNAVRRGGSRA